ncbi:erythroblast NAD(P)(+)--arginine ADP-ribosyltransferase-like isoform X1 [Anas platyrhynchos]|uniref:erythroblast NAD(P)(+)--arginine ADP-ribosyltransferase-like isoform X1 n=1 Tax=Anas platyrhynchos TaxID=8839 RepID=UPI003AF22BFB
MEQLALGWVLLASTLFGTAATGSRRDVRAITEKVMDMAQDSFDDQYKDCRTEMEEKLKTVNRTEFQNKAYADTWRRAAKHWQKQWGNSNRPQVLPQEQAVAVLAYTDKGDLSKQLNKAMLEGGLSHEDYLESFPFKTLHFLLTEALHTLRKTQSPKCNSVYRGTTDRFTAQLNEHVRFGQFTSTSLQKEVAESFGQHTFFFVNTCYGVSIRSFSFFPEQEEVLIPPYEVFKVTNVIHHTEGTHIHLDSHSTHSNYKCALLNEKRCKAQPCVFSAGMSSPREPPHLWSLLLAAAALAAVGCL